MQALALETLNYGSYDHKDEAINLRLNHKDKQGLKKLADSLGLPVNLLLRVLIKQAIAQNAEGINPIPTFDTNADKPKGNK
ncbi:hypothetical protein [Nostoc sp. UIC 10607]|uniref:hypothetical protein n=1 Tax=Nostoc sp. UIC 10607 TaxID=3045935 RepID=UPI00399EF1B3